MTPQVWQQVEQLFADAMDREPADRAQWLAAQNVQDPAVLREVERLLDAVDDAPGAVSGAVAESVRELNSEQPLQPPPETRIGPYEILSEIGRGGMGVVYLARRDDDVFHKQVAIKVVKRGMDTDQILTRFRHERRILARLDHPYIARILDGGSTADGLPYLVMEHIDGLRITDYCDQKKLNLTHRLELFQKVCAAVEYAHQNLVIHRDLKPSNILVEESGSPKLLDFGIAKLLDEDTEGLTTLTSDGMRLLTPRHASPEQVLGEPITTASDIYSLGTILYELLTGSSVHRITGTTPASLIRAVCTDETLRRAALSKMPRTRPSTRRTSRAIGQRSANGAPQGTAGTLRFRSPVLRRSAALHRKHAGARTPADLTVPYRKISSPPSLRNPRCIAGLLSLIGGIAASTYQARRAERRFFQLRNLANSFLFDIHDQLETFPAPRQRVRP